MEKLVGCCGFKCYMCAAYEGNIHSYEDRQRVCDKWERYFEYPVPVEKMHCEGCRTCGDADAPMIHGDCEFLVCAREKNVENCKACDEYPCSNLKEYLDAYKEAYDTMKADIDEEDVEGYFLCFQP